MNYDYIKDNIDEIKYVQNFIKLKKIGSIYRGNCPFHSERTPSLTIYPKGYWNRKTHKSQEFMSFYCFGCGAYGDLIKFVQLKNNLEYREDAAKLLLQEFGLINNDDLEIKYILQNDAKFENKIVKMLDNSQINLICSSICRNYLKYVQENYIKYYNEEMEFIDNLYKYIDEQMEECNAIEINSLYNDIRIKINDRKKELRNKK